MSEASRASEGVPEDSMQVRNGLHDEFRHLLTLLILACAYNSGGVPILSGHKHGITQPSQEDEIAFRKLTSRGILSAIATIFVRNHEILAVTDVTPTNIVSAIMNPPKLEDGSIIPGPLFASLENPRAGNVLISTTDSNVAPYGLVRDGVPVDLWLWALQSEDDFWNHLLDKSFDAGEIIDHVATVTHFMTKHVAEKDFKKRIALLHRFKQYIVVVCFPKMTYRISHWATIGMIRNLCFLPHMKPNLFSEFKDYSMNDAYERHKKRNDQTLIEQLTTLSEEHLALIRNQHPEYPATNISFDNLVLAARSNPPSIYNKDTSAEFHNLLISVLFGYAINLHGLVHMPTTGTHGDKVLHAKGIFFYLHLLWDIQESQAYRLHFDFIGPHLEPIEFSSCSDYRKFADEVEFKFRMPSGMGRRQESDAVESTDQDDYNDSNDSDDGDDGDDGDGVSPPVSPPCRNALRFRIIISTLVAYVGAIRMLQRYCVAISESSVTGNFHASLISTKRPEQVTISWTGIENALSNVKLQGVSVREMKDTISNIVKSTKPSHYHYSLSLFRNLVNNPGSNVKYPTSTLHCEALLGALICYGPRDQCSEDLLKLIQASKASESKTIAVSKLCCPVCWELLSILDDKPTVTRGRHSTLYFQHLPSWLPREVLDKMLERFRVYAAVELQRAYTKHNTSLKSHAQSPSQETAYAVSIASAELEGDRPEDKALAQCFPPPEPRLQEQGKHERRPKILPNFFTEIQSMATNAMKYMRK